MGQNKNLIQQMAIILLLFAGLAVAEQGEDLTTLTLEELLEIEVTTATRYAKSSEEAPASLTIITAEDIANFGYTTVAEALNSVRGFHITNDRAYSYVGIRGFGRIEDYNNRVLLLLNGHPLNENYYGAAYVGNELAININSVERIEIVRGPGSALYGTGAMFGVINVVTKSVESFQGVQVSAEGGSLGTRQYSALASGRLTSHGHISVSGLWSQADGARLYFPELNQLATNYGVSEGHDWSKRTGMHSTLTLGKWNLQGMYSKREKAIPTGVWGSDFNSDLTKEEDQIANFTAGYSTQLNAAMRLQLTTSYDDYRWAASYPYDAYLYFDESWGRWISSEVEYFWDIRPDFRTITGISYQHHLQAEYKSAGQEGEIYFQKDEPYKLLSFFTQGEFYPWSNVSVILGVRGDSYSRSGSFVSPRVATVYHPCATTTLKAIFGRAFRVPTIGESYNGSTDNGWVINDDLKSESVTSSEVALEQRLSKSLLAALSLYENRVGDLIEKSNDSNEEDVVFLNIGKVRARGIELELQGRWAEGVQLFANYAYQNAKDSKSGEYLANYSTHLARGGFSSPLFRHVKLGWECQYESGRLTGLGARTTPSLLSNLNVRIRPKLQNQGSGAQLLSRFEVSLTVKNLFDESYAVPGDLTLVQDLIPQDGRTYLAKLTFHL